MGSCHDCRLMWECTAHCGWYNSMLRLVKQGLYKEWTKHKSRQVNKHHLLFLLHIHSWITHLTSLRDGLQHGRLKTNQNRHALRLLKIFENLNQFFSVSASFHNPLFLPRKPVNHLSASFSSLWCFFLNTLNSFLIPWFFSISPQLLT